MANITKEEILAYLDYIKKRQGGIRSAKYIAVAAFRIFVKKGIVTPDDVVDEIPEIENVNLLTSIMKEEEEEKEKEESQSS